MTKTKATLIYLDNGDMVLTKKEYHDWREIQDEWEHYQANLMPLAYENIMDFFETDFKEEENWPFSKDELIQFFAGEAEMIYSTN